MATKTMMTKVGAAVFGALLLAGCAGNSPVVTVTVAPSDDVTATATPSPEVVAEETTEPAPEETTDKPKPETTTQKPKPGTTTETSTATETETEEPEPEGPTLSVKGQACNSGKLIVSLKANYSSGYRKGVDSIVVERQNEYDAWLDYDASWLGPETGAGNEWNATVNNLDGETLRITAESKDNTYTVLTVDVDAPC